MPSMTQEGYWRSLGELAGSEEFRQHLAEELPGLDEANPSSVSRRRFMQLMGASVALASLQACRWETEKILPMASRPEGLVPGIPHHYATAMELGGVSRPLRITSYDGRPVKVEGNPLHAASLGSADSWAQASILELCDPERSKAPSRRDGKGRKAASWSDFFATMKPVFRALAEKRGRGLAILSEASEAPSVAMLRAELASKLPEAVWHSHEPVSFDNMVEGTKLALGSPMRPLWDLARATRILCLDADIFGVFPDRQRLARGWSAGRDPDGQMNRLYAVESVHSATGAAADHRLPLQSQRILSFALALEEELRDGPVTAPMDGKVGGFLRAVAEDLKAAGAGGLVIAGPDQPALVHAAVARINAVLGAGGRSLRYRAVEDRPTDARSLKALAESAGKGEVETLVVVGANPVFASPADLDFGGLLPKIANTVHLGLHEDETAAACAWHLPRSHYLECWGDGRTWDGSWTLQQPLIRPLHDTRSAIEVLATLLRGEEQKGLDLVQEAFRSRFGADSDARWRKSLHDGFVADSAPETSVPPIASLDLSKVTRLRLEAARADGSDLELVFKPSAAIYDGRFANNGWLQELPDYMSKLTWDNAVHVSPNTAKALDLDNGDVVELDLRGRKLECAVYVMPGQATGSLSIALGYGRRAAGSVGGSESKGIDPVGFDAYALQDSRAPGCDVGVTVRKTGRTHALATTQEHHAIDPESIGDKGIAERLPALVREDDLDHYKEHPDFAGHRVHHPPLESLWKQKEYDGPHRWGMTIDLNKCVGCNACVIGCQSENNIPIVGKEDVLKGREMHWIRIDRYFKGAPEEAEAVGQAVPCMQCENAPCEQVCPVAATVHSAEGLNDMVYNRCVGTRYCANNCPYKVRRFNFFNYHKDLKDPANEVKKLAFNPDVTVRARGVMEKCTYCVQRIRFGVQQARTDKRALRDGEIKVACQQACPSDAIVFGDLADEGSAVAKSQKGPRAYAMLQELNVRPRTLYLAKVNNPNPDLRKGGDEHGSNH